MKETVREAKTITSLQSMKSFQFNEFLISYINWYC